MFVSIALYSINNMDIDIKGMGVLPRMGVFSHLTLHLILFCQSSARTFEKSFNAFTSNSMWRYVESDGGTAVFVLVISAVVRPNRWVMVLLLYFNLV